MTVSAINPYQPLPPAVGTSYGNIMDAFFSTLSDAEKQVIWVKFLTENNLTEPVPPGNEELFLTFVQHLIASDQVTVPTYVNDTLSPEEIKKRNIMFGVINSVINMLLSLQDTVTVQSQNLAFFAKWQKNYTDMLTRVPNYVGGESSNVHVDLNDLSKFTLGYNDISIEDIAKWWAQQQQDGSTDTYSITSMTNFTLGLLQFTSINFTPTGINATLVTNNIFGQAVSGIGTSVSIPAGATFDQNVQNFEDAFKTFYTTNQSTFAAYAGQQQAYRNFLTQVPYVVNGTDFVSQGLAIQAQIFTGGSSDPNIAYQLIKPYTFTAIAAQTSAQDPGRNLAEGDSKSRAEINSRNQQYVENVRSLRQTVQNVQQEVQANLDQSRQVLPQQADLISSIVDSLKGILASIYR